MKISIVVSADFTDENMLRKELFKIIELYSRESDYSKFTYIYLNTESNKILDNIFKLLDLKTFKITPNWEKDKDLAYYKAIEKMMKTCLKNKRSLHIDFQEFHSLTKQKKTLYKKYTDKLNIFMIYYSLTGNTLKCCDQELTYLNDLAKYVSDTFDYFQCEICKNKYVLLQELIDEYLITDVKVDVIKRINYLKGEYQ